MPNSAPYTAYRFSGFTLDLERGALLTTDRRELPLRPKSFALLRLLVENAGRLLSRDAILEVVWPDIFVSDDTITQSIRDIRRALGADAQEILRTLPRRGYLFTSDVVRAPAAPLSLYRNGTGGPGSDGPPSPATSDPVERNDQTSVPSAAQSREESDIQAAAGAESDKRFREPRAAERRQMTVMACEVIGLVALAGCLDPEDLREVGAVWHRCCADIIEQHHGYIASYATDGLLAWFGYPQANEDNAERAVQAGLAVADAVSKLTIDSGEPLQLSVGIATGVVVVGDEATNGTLTVTATGSTLILAERLRTLAGAGRIAIADSTRRLIGNAFKLTYAGEHPTVGFEDPVHGWRVEHALARESRFDAHRGDSDLTQLVGRNEELDLLFRRWTQAKDGEGQVVLLSGEAGIGKSRILSTLRQRLEARDVQALRLQCSPYHINSAFWPIIDNLERTLKFVRDETTDAKLDKLETLIVTQNGRPLADVRFVASILSIPYEARYGALKMTPQKHKDETVRSLVDLVEATACQRSSVLLFEDTHWADPTTLEVLDLLIDRVKTVPLLIVLTHRPDFQSRWSQGHVGALSLSKLTLTQSAAMVSTLAGGKGLPAALLEQILTRADGVPLFVEELTRSILESGELQDLGSRYEYARSTHAVTIPATLRDSLMARLDRLAQAKQTAQIGAVIGREFSYELIAAVAPMCQAQLHDSLARLTESGLAFRRGTPPDALYTFKHALVQGAAYDSLLKSHRQELHAKIANVIQAHLPNIKITEPEVLAHHLTAAGLAEDAVPLWQTAGELALKRMALTEAVSHLNQGLGLVSALPRSPRRDASELELRSLLGAACIALNGWAAPEVWTSLHPALALATSLKRNDAHITVFGGLFQNILNQGRVADALPWGEEMLDLAKSSGDAYQLIAGHVLGCASNCFAGKFAKTVEHAKAVFDLYDAETHRYVADMVNHDPKTLAGIYGSISTWILGCPNRALRLSDENDAHARRRSHPVDLGWALTFSAEVFNRHGEFEKLRKRAEECERLGRENSLPVLSAFFAPVSYSLALFREGRTAEGIAPLKAGIAFWETIGGRLGMPIWNAFLAEALALTGDLDNALLLIDEQIVQIERPGWEERLSYAEILRLKGWMLSIKGDLEGAEREFLASLDCARHQRAKSWELRTSTSLARLWQGQGKRQDAHELLTPVYNWFTEGFDTRDLQEAKSLLAELV